jgi:hypothetical protein
MFKWIDDFLKPYQFPKNYNFIVTDKEGSEHSLIDLCSSLAKKVVELEERIIKLEDENVSLTNELYRLENSLEARIDILTSESYNLNKFSLEK